MRKSNSSHYCSENFRKLILKQLKNSFIIFIKFWYTLTKSVNPFQRSPIKFELFLSLVIECGSKASMYNMVKAKSPQKDIQLTQKTCYPKDCKTTANNDCHSKDAPKPVSRREFRWKRSLLVITIGDPFWRTHLEFPLGLDPISRSHQEIPSEDCVPPLKISLSNK